MKRINVKLLVILLTVTLVTAVITVALHNYQAKRRADGLLVRVEQLRGEQKFAEAVRLLRAYCARRPDDHTQLSNLALTMKDVLDHYKLESDIPLDPRERERTFLTIETALRRNENDRPLREAAVELDMKWGRYQDAIYHLDRLIEMEPSDDDSHYRVDLATCYRLTGKEADAVRILQQLVGFDESSRTFRPDQAVAPKEVEAYNLLAMIYEQKSNREFADLVMNELTTANPDNAAAWLQRATFAQVFRKDSVAAAQAIDKALACSPDDKDSLLMGGQIAIQAGQYDRAKGMFEKLLELEPKSVGAFSGLSTWAAAKGDRTKAIEYLQTGLQENPNELTLLWQKANTEVEMGRLDLAEQTLVDIKNAKFRQFFVDFLEGRILLAKREWLEASNKLASSRPYIAQFRQEWADALDHYLAVCYEQLGKHDQRLEVIDRVLETNPNNIALRFGRAQALAALHQNDRAIEEFDLLRRLIPDPSILPPTMLGAFFDLEVMKQMSKPEADRQWKDAEKLVELIAKNPSVPRTVAGTIMERFFRASGQNERADALFKKVLSLNPQNLALQLDKVYRQSLQPDGLESALRELTKLRAEKGDLAELRLLEANILASNRTPDLLPRLKELSQGLDNYTNAQKSELYYQLGRYFTAEREYETARDLWVKYAEMNPTDIEHAMRLFELDIVSNQIAQSQESIQRIESIVTRDGAEYKWAKAATMTLEVQSQKRPKSDLIEALAMVDDAIASRKNWEAPYRLQGEIHTLRGEYDEAIASFEKAISAGSLNAETYKRLVRLYYEKGNYRRCKEMLDKLPKNAWQSIEQKINVDVLAKLGQLPEEIEYDKSSKEPGYHVQIGTILINAERFDEAQAAFERAVELAPNSAEAWGALFENYLRQGNTDEANQVLERGKAQIAQADLPKFLATSYQLLGKWDEAEKFYLEALKTTPDDQRMLAQLAKLYASSGKNEQAIKLLQQIAESEPPYLKAPRDVVAWARRTLAVIVSQSGTYEDFQRGLTLIESNAAQGAILGPQDLAQWAALCTRRPDPATRRRAIEQLELAGDERGLQDEEKLVLAELYKLTGNWSRCESVMLDLLVKHGNDVRFLTPWLTWLIEEKEFGKAATYVTKVPANSMVAVRTMAHIYAHDGKTTDAIKAVAALMPKNPTAQEISQVVAIAAILEELGTYDPVANKYSEKVWLQTTKLNASNLIQLASFYNRREDQENALKGIAAAGQYFKLGIPQQIPALQVLVQILRTHYRQLSSDASVENTLRGYFEQAGTDQPENGTVLVLRSEFEELMGKSRESESYLREYLKKPQANPRDRAVVLNNLGYRLAVRGEGEEAAKLIDEAEKLLGPRPELRDTKGMVFVALKKYDEAIREFQASIDDGGPDAIKYFHLGLSQWRAGNRDAAVAAVRDAQGMKIDQATMTAFERQQYDDLLRDMRRVGAIEDDLDAK